MRQFTKYGLNLENASGTGPSVEWAKPLAGYIDSMGYRRSMAEAPAQTIETLFRDAYNATQAAGNPVTFLQLVLEEVAEAFMEDDPEKLATELVQVAALCVSWVEKIRYDTASKCNPEYAGTL